MGVQFNQKVRFIVGTDEESNWTGMHRYFEVEPAPTYGFSPDAEFPVINGEKGQVSLLLDLPGGNGSDDLLLSFKSGLRFNMVPREADAVVAVSDNEALAAAYTAFLDNNPVTGEFSVGPEGAHLHLIGKAAHGMEPEKGVNAATYLATFLQTLQLGGNAKNFVDYLANYLHLDTRMDKFNAAYTDPVMGELTMNAGLLSFDARKGGHVDMNFRFPKGLTPDELEQEVAAVANRYQFTVHYDRFETPHYVDPTDPLVQTLMKAYIDQTGDQDAKPEVVGGGTYGRLMDRGVAFGALMPQTPNTMHQANEFQPVADLIKSMAIYMQAIHDLVTK